MAQFSQASSHGFPSHPEDVDVDGRRQTQTTDDRRQDRQHLGRLPDDGMQDVMATTGRRLTDHAAYGAGGRTWANQTAMFQLPIFGDEPTHAEVTRSLDDDDDVLLSGSDDEYYESRTTRIRRYEEQARLFLEGRRPLLLSASLRGPFSKASGWENPWRGKGKDGKARAQTRMQRTPVSTTEDARVTAAGGDAQVATPASGRALGTTPPSILCANKTPEAKKRVAGADWLRRQNVKRMRPCYGDLPTDSPSASRSSKAAKAAQAAKTDGRKRAVSAPVEEAVLPDEGSRGNSGLSDMGSSGLRDTLSHISDSGRSMSVPSDSLWVEDHAKSVPARVALAGLVDGQATSSSQEGTQMKTQKDDSFCFKRRVSRPKKIGRPPLAVDQKGSPEVAMLPPAAVAEPVFQHGQTSASAPEMGETGRGNAEEPLVSHETLPEQAPVDGISAQDQDPSHGRVVDSPQGSEKSVTSCGSTDELSMGHFDDTTATTGVMDASVQQDPTEGNPPKPVEGDDMADVRAATQDQSPWAKSAETAPDENPKAASPAVADELDGEHADETDSAPPAAQSPWIRDAAWEGRLSLSSVLVREGGLDAGLPETNGASTGLSQNPWAADGSIVAPPLFSSSLPNRPSTPSSPGLDTGLQSLACEKAEEEQEQEQGQDQDQDQQPCLPSLSLAALPAPPSSGTAPSTPETKQSSLPTPDLTVSIKSFRRFRSPTPTPPPRRRGAKAHGPPSILVRSRGRLSASSRAAKPCRCVHFALPGDDASASSHDSQPQRAASPPPQDRLLMEHLPSEVDRFQDHFSMVASRSKDSLPAAAAVDSRRFTMPPLGRTEPANIAIYSSPAVEAMASRFQEADGVAMALKLQPTPSQRLPPTQHAGSSGGCMSGDSSNKENGGGQHDDDDAENDGSSAVDDVQDVLDNMDEFLGLWDMDAELAQIRAGSS